MAGRDLRSETRTRPLVHRNREVCCAQDGKTQPGCVSKSELDCARLKLRRRSQQRRGCHDARGIEQLGAGTSVGGVESTGGQDFAVRQEGGNVLAAATG